MQLDDTLTIGELQDSQSHLCAQQNQGIEPPGNVLWCMENKDIFGTSQHGFTKGKLYLKNLMTFYNRVVESVVKSNWLHLPGLKQNIATVPCL